VKQDSDDFLEQSRRKRSSLAVELYRLLRHNKRWWLTPIIVVMLLLGLISLFAGGSVAPFIYTLF
jgi:fluoride ion exporter CrcB/FEX